MAEVFSTLGELPVGSDAYLPVRLTFRDDQELILAPLGDVAGSRTPQGELTVDVGTVGNGSVGGGGWTVDPLGQQVRSFDRPLQVGDLLQGADGQVTMALAVGLGPEFSWWSSYADGRNPQPADGFLVVGHADVALLTATPPP
jgi:hypothetical protein